ncbi:glutamate racemase [Kordiimonas aquimaris]|uniref:glutamate racemase n=1 Tax=Kordiimonas aquimaris TaxID=707591 RepID=UPI0021D21E11|nr:glutamate racemase [Kordiimonas aquimaris]
MIGVFDSGSGGLTILNALKKQLPNQKFLYLGDHGHAPYGHRSNEQIVALTRLGVDHLMHEGCSLVILACNTAAAIALRTLQQEWLPTEHPEKRVLGVLVPMVEAITNVPWAQQSPASHPEDNKQNKQRVLLFATSKTIESGAYVEEIAKRAPHVELVQKACPGLVDAIEGGAGTAPLQGLINGYISELDMYGIETAVLGCTHFPLVEKLFKAALPDTVKLYSQADIVASSLKNYLERHPEFISADTPSTTLLTSGDPRIVDRVSKRLGVNEQSFIMYQ